MNTEDDEFARIAREQALNKMADNARKLGLDYEPAQQEPVDSTQISKVWWDGEKLMAKPIPFVEFYKPAQRKPLTVVEIMREWRTANDSVVDFARAIEAAHGIKEST